MRLTDQDRHHALSHIEIDITEACNFKCDACSRVCVEAPSKAMLPLATISAFVDESISLGKRWQHIMLIGGEPTLHPELLGILSELERYMRFSEKTAVSMMTNGGPSFAACRKDMPRWLHFLGRPKNTQSRTDPSHHAFYIAPIDVDRWEKPPLKCYAPAGCGVGLTVHGYYPCCLCGGLYRVFSDRLPRGVTSIKKMLDPAFFNNLDLFCKLCGWYLVNDGSIKKYPIKHKTKTWSDALARYNRQAPSKSNLIPGKK